MDEPIHVSSCWSDKQTLLTVWKPGSAPFLKKSQHLQKEGREVLPAFSTMTRAGVLNETLPSDWNAKGKENSLFWERKAWFISTMAAMWNCTESIQHHYSIHFWRTWNASSLLHFSHAYWTLLPEKKFYYYTHTCTRKNGGLHFNNFQEENHRIILFIIASICSLLMGISGSEWFPTLWQ